mgnify:CR=1 FL=1
MYGTLNRHYFFCPRNTKQRPDLLLEEDRTETRVESTNALILEDLGESGQQTAGKGGLRDETDTSGLQRAQGDIGEELSQSGRSKVDGSAVVGGGLVAKLVDELLLEELVATELQGTLEEVTGGSWAETGEQSSSTLILDDLAEATEQTLVVGHGIKLNSSLDAVRIKNVSIEDQTIVILWLRGSRQTKTYRCRNENGPIQGSEGKEGSMLATYTSTGVRAPWVTEQQTAPAKANLEYSWKPLSFCSWVLALAAILLDSRGSGRGSSGGVECGREGNCEE